MKNYIKRLLTADGNMATTIWIYLTLDALWERNLVLSAMCLITTLIIGCVVSGIKEGKILK